MIGLSANDLSSHGRWIQDINETSKTDLQFPMIADADRKIAFAYDMDNAQDVTNKDDKGIAFTIRTVSVIVPAKKIRLTRVIDSLQTGDGAGAAIPINWIPGDDVIVPRSLSTENVRKKFGDVREVKP